jgi:hypothetical protein
MSVNEMIKVMDLYPDVFFQLREWVMSSGGLTPENITQFVVKVIQSAAKIEVNGSTKKQIAMELINEMIIEYSGNEEKTNKEDLLFIVSCVIPQMIDCMIDIDKRRTTVSDIKKKKRWFDFFGCSS